MPSRTTNRWTTKVMKWQTRNCRSQGEVRIKWREIRAFVEGIRRTPTSDRGGER